MRKAALYVQGRVVIGDSHLEAYQKLTLLEQQEHVVSGVFDTDTEEFDSDLPIDHFYNKELIFVRHGQAADPDEPDSELSEEGKVQIQQVCSYLLKTFEIKSFVGLTSPLLRCLQSALIIHELLDLDFEVQPGVMEIPIFLEEDQQYRLQNHRSKFPQFRWSTSEDWILTTETQRNFLNRTKQALQEFPSRCIVITHYGFICNVARFALCDQKANVVATGAVPPASVTFIDKQEVKCLGWTHEENSEDRPPSFV